MKQEFAVGDKVTFFPYEKRLKCVVKEVLIESGEVLYYLRGEGKVSVQSITSGRCIEESIYFEPYQE